jgi:hypothetical protein
MSENWTQLFCELLTHWQQMVAVGVGVVEAPTSWLKQALSVRHVCCAGVTQRPSPEAVSEQTSVLRNRTLLSHVAPDPQTGVAAEQRWSGAQIACLFVIAKTGPATV